MAPGPGVPAAPGRRAPPTSAAPISPAPSQLRGDGLPIGTQKFLSSDPLETPWHLSSPITAFKRTPGPGGGQSLCHIRALSGAMCTPVSHRGPQQGRVHAHVTPGPSAGPCARPACHQLLHGGVHPALLLPASRPAPPVPFDTGAGGPETNGGRTARSGSWRPALLPFSSWSLPLLHALSALCHPHPPMLRVMTGHPQQATRTPKPSRPSEALAASARGASGPGGCLAQPRGRRNPCLWDPGTGRHR